MTGKFRTQINWCEHFFKHLSLFEEKIDTPSVIATPLGTIRKMNYQETWKFYFSNQLYHFQLKDSSILYFLYTSDKSFSFSYYQCPYDVLTYKDFLLGIGFDFYEVGEDLMGEYSLYIEQANIREAPISFRYDYAPKDYNTGLHPASHLHIGFDSNIRIGFDSIIDPQAFVLLITRQCYPNAWSNLISGNEKFRVYEKLLASYKSQLDKIDKNHYKIKDQYEHYLL